MYKALLSSQTTFSELLNLQKIQSDVSQEGGGGGLLRSRTTFSELLNLQKIQSDVSQEGGGGFREKLL